MIEPNADTGQPWWVTVQRFIAGVAQTAAFYSGHATRGEAEQLAAGANQRAESEARHFANVGESRVYRYAVCQRSVEGATE